MASIGVTYEFSELALVVQNGFVGGLVSGGVDIDADIHSNEWTIAAIWMDGYGPNNKTENLHLDSDSELYKLCHAAIMRDYVENIQEKVNEAIEEDRNPDYEM